MSRLTQSDIIRAQEARIDSLTLMVERLTEMHGETLAALTEKGNPRTASETVKLARSATGDHTTALAFEVVVQEDETLEQALARAGDAFERAAARYPMPNGYAHPAPLGDPDKPRTEPSLSEQLEASAKDELASKRAKGKDK